MPFDGTDWHEHGEPSPQRDYGSPWVDDVIISGIAILSALFGIEFYWFLGVMP